MGGRFYEEALWDRKGRLKKIDDGDDYDDKNRNWAEMSRAKIREVKKER